MKKMQIYEPAMCCSTGICGVSVDPELLRIATAVNTLQEHGIEVERFNLTSAPMEFINNKEINELINSENGVEKLPATVVDDKIVFTGRYPTNDEITSTLHIPAELLPTNKKVRSVRVNVQRSGGCGCSDGSCC
ncbi:MAG: arsD [Herbinix sp.]|jgi:hypothetical protein|nr:arsD [Herbinix sp.]